MGTGVSPERIATSNVGSKEVLFPSARNDLAKFKELSSY